MMMCAVAIDHTPTSHDATINNSNAGIESTNRGFAGQTAFHKENIVPAAMNSHYILALLLRQTNVSWGYTEQGGGGGVVRWLVVQRQNPPDASRKYSKGSRKKLAPL